MPLGDSDEGDLHEVAESPSSSQVEGQKGVSTQGPGLFLASERGVPQGHRLSLPKQALCPPTPEWLPGVLAALVSSETWAISGGRSDHLLVDCEFAAELWQSLEYSRALSLHGNQLTLLRYFDHHHEGSGPPAILEKIRIAGHPGRMDRVRSKSDHHPNAACLPCGNGDRPC